MKKRDGLRILIVLLFLSIIVFMFAWNSSNITNMVIIEFNDENKFNSETGFLIKSLDYVINGNKLDITYYLKEEINLPQKLNVESILRSFDGEKISESYQNITLSAGQTKEYKLILDYPLDTNKPLKFSLTISNERGSEWTIKEIGKSRSYITGLTALDLVNEGKVAWILMIVILILVYLIIIYLKRHHARTRNIFPAHKRKVLIPLDLKENNKKRV
ncbi:MAG: hypothetical protein Q8L29_00610 [archaeon]|nr:hypothetical protein [archaeon]